MAKGFLDPSSPLKQIGKDILFYVPAKVIPVITGFLGIAAYTRLLEPKEYGWYILLTTTISFVHAFAFGWSGYVIWRYFEKYKNEQDLSRFLSTIVTALAALFFIIALFWCLVTIFFTSYFEARFASLLRVGILVLGAQAGYNMVLTILQVNRQSVKYSLYTLVNSLGTLLLAVGLIYFLSWSVEGVLWASLIFMGGASCLELHQFYKNWRISPLYFSGRILTKLAAFGLPQIGISVGALILSIFDRYMIEAFRNTEEVGIYSAGYTLADMSIQIPLGVLMLAALPVIVQTFENRREEETRLLFKKLFSLYLIFLVPAVFGIAALSRDVVEVLLGQPFRLASAILPWVAAGTFFFGFSQYANIPFQLKEKPHLLLYLIILAGFLNIILNFILIPPLGILGAAYATLIAYFLYSIVSYTFSNRILRLLFPWQTLIRSVLASIGMYLILHLVKIDFVNKTLGLIMQIVLGALSYFIILLLLKEPMFWGILKHLNRYLRGRWSFAR